MPKNIVAIRQDRMKGGIKLTAIRSSARGTRYLGPSKELKATWTDKEQEKSAIEAAILELYAA